MKRIFLTFSLALVALIASAQEDSVEVYRFTYNYCDSNVYAKRNYPDRMHLDVYKNGASEFYSEYGQTRASVATINATGMSQAEMMTQIEKLKATKAGVAYRLLKDFPEKGKLTFADRIATSSLYYTEEIPQPDWTLSDGEKEICGYQCKKAEADFCGRHWTAWYAEDLPMNNGPWKLGGLPGLILEASDTDDYFHFTCVGIETAKTIPTTKLNKKFVKSSRKDFDRLEREYFKDTMAFLLNQIEGEGKTVKIQDERGNEIKSAPKERHIFIERMSGDEF